MKDQKIGSCAWASAKGGFRALLYATMVEKGVKPEIAKSLSHKIYKMWSMGQEVGDREASANKALDRYEEAFAKGNMAITSQINWDLLLFVFAKFKGSTKTRDRLQNFLNEHPEKVNWAAKDRKGCALFLASQVHTFSDIKALIDTYHLPPNFPVKALIIDARDMAFRSGRHDIMKVLLDKYPFLVNQQQQERTPLMIAARNGDIKYAQLLLDAGANIEDPSGDWTAIHQAAIEGHQEIMELFLSHDPNTINLATDDGKTPLMFAVIYGQDNFAAFCLDQGADHKTRTDRGRSAYDYATHDFLKLRTPHPDLINRLGDGGVKEKSLELSI